MPQHGRSTPIVSDRNYRSLRSALLVIALLTTIGMGHYAKTSFGQQPESDTVDRERQTLHDPATLEPADSAPPASELSGAADGSAPPAEADSSAELASKRDLLGEKIAEGEGAEPGVLPFESGENSFVLVTTKPHITRQQAKNELDRLMLETANERYKAAVHSPRVTFWYPLDLAYVRSELLIPDGERFIANAAGQPGYVGHALLAFDKPFERRLRAVRVASRSMQIVAAGGTILALMIVAFAFLRLDRATRGLYTGRLQTWALVACAVVACVTGVVAYWIPWI